MIAASDSLRWNLYKATNARPNLIEEIIEVFQQHLIDIGCDDAAALLSDPREEKQAKTTGDADEFFGKKPNVYAI